jgi:hypothetical protein
VFLATNCLVVMVTKGERVQLRNLRHDCEASCKVLCACAGLLSAAYAVPCFLAALLANNRRRGRLLIALRGFES